MSPPAVRESGPRDAPAVMFLHGFMGSRRDWAPVTQLLAGTLRCIVVDLPGHGETAPAQGESVWSTDGCVAALAGVLRSAGGGGVVGYSLGGRLALQLAIEHPDVVDRAVILSASPGVAHECGRAQRRNSDEGLARRLEAQGLEPFLKGWYELPLFAALREHPRFAEVLERRRRNDPRLLARSLRAMGAGAQRSLWADLPGLRIPLLFLAGERDAKYVDLASEAARLCPQARMIVVPGSGHALVEEAPEAVTRELAVFFGGGNGVLPGES